MFPAGRNHDTSAGIFFGSSRKVRGANKGLGEAPKSCTRKEHESATNSIARRGQGAIAPCRVKGQRPLWGLGQRPNSSTGDQHLNALNKGAGSEASLPVTLRVRRRAPQLLFPQESVMNLFFCLTASIRPCYDGIAAVLLFLRKKSCNFSRNHGTKSPDRSS